MIDTVLDKLELKRRLPQIRVGAVVALAAAAGVVAWLVLRGDDDEAPEPPAAATLEGVETISLAALRARAAAAEQPIYWAGRLPGRRFEISEARGRIFIRYLPGGVAAGSRKPYLTVATYRHANAYDATRTVARGPGVVRIGVGPRGVAFYARGRPTSVYLAYRGEPYQIEIFHPVPRVAHRLVSSRRVRPIAAAP